MAGMNMFKLLGELFQIVKGSFRRSARKEYRWRTKLGLLFLRYVRPLASVNQAERREESSIRGMHGAESQALRLTG